MTNPFHQRGANIARTKSTAELAVHHSFWSSLQAKGYPASDAAKCAWAILWATKPSHKKHQASVTMLSELDTEHLNELMAMCVRAEASPRMTDPERQALIGQCRMTLEGLRDGATAPPPADVGYVLSAEELADIRLRQSVSATLEREYIEANPGASRREAKPHVIAAFDARFALEQAKVGS